MSDIKMPEWTGLAGTIKDMDLESDGELRRLALMMTYGLVHADLSSSREKTAIGYQVEQFERYYDSILMMLNNTQK